MAATIGMGPSRFAAMGRSYARGAREIGPNAGTSPVGAAHGSDRALQERRNAYGS